jgi:hypothetical protein
MAILEHRQPALVRKSGMSINRDSDSNLTRARPPRQIRAEIPIDGHVP